MYCCALVVHMKAGYDNNIRERYGLQAFFDQKGKKQLNIWLKGII